MAEIRETHTVFGPFPDADPLDTARLFLRTNGYAVVEEERGPPPPELEVEPPRRDEPDDDSVDEAELPAADDAEPDDAEPDDAEPDDEPADTSEESDATDEGEAAAADDDEEPAHVVPTPDEIITTLTVERGTRGRGWFSSNLTELHTRIELRLAGNKMSVEYTVDTTGQHLWDEEKDFWKKEARALEKYVVESSDLLNMAESERERASEVRRDFVVMGFWIGAIVAVLLFLVLITLFRAV